MSSRRGAVRARRVGAVLSAALLCATSLVVTVDVAVASTPSAPAAGSLLTTHSSVTGPQHRWGRRLAWTRPASPSVMVQLSTLAQVTTPVELTSVMQLICTPRVRPTGHLVLQDVADSDGTLLTGLLDALVPFLPGGSVTPCFSRVYVGTLDPSWDEQGSIYTEAIQDATFVGDYLRRSHAVAQSFVNRYPQVEPDWYLSYEANLNDLYHPGVEAGFRSLLAAETASRASLRRDGRVLWSPAFWYPYDTYRSNIAGMAGLRASLSRLFTTLRDAGHPIDDLNLQDFVAGSSCQPSWNRVTRQDAVGWLRFAAGLDGAPNVTMNVEQFAFDCASGGVTHGDRAEVRARESYYRSQGITLGPAFELRYWLHNHR